MYRLVYMRVEKVIPNPNMHELDTDNRNQADYMVVYKYFFLTHEHFVKLILVLATWRRNCSQHYSLDIKCPVKKRCLALGRYCTAYKTYVWFVVLNNILYVYSRDIIIQELHGDALRINI